jgi:hypothetical protein
MMPAYRFVFLDLFADWIVDNNKQMKFVNGTRVSREDRQQIGLLLGESKDYIFKEMRNLGYSYEFIGDAHGDLGFPNALPDIVKTITHATNTSRPSPCNDAGVEAEERKYLSS